MGAQRRPPQQHAVLLPAQDGPRGRRAGRARRRRSGASSDRAQSGHPFGHERARPPRRARRRPGSRPAGRGHRTSRGRPRRGLAGPAGPRRSSPPRTRSRSGSRARRPTTSSWPPRVRAEALYVAGRDAREADGVDHVLVHGPERADTALGQGRPPPRRATSRPAPPSSGRAPRRPPAWAGPARDGLSRAVWRPPSRPRLASTQVRRRVHRLVEHPRRGIATLARRVRRRPAIGVRCGPVRGSASPRRAAPSVRPPARSPRRPVGRPCWRRTRPARRARGTGWRAAPRRSATAGSGPPPGSWATSRANQTPTRRALPKLAIPVTARRRPTRSRTTSTTASCSRGGGHRAAQLVHHRRVGQPLARAPPRGPSPGPSARSRSSSPPEVLEETRPAPARSSSRHRLPRSWRGHMPRSLGSGGPCTGCGRLPDTGLVRLVILSPTAASAFSLQLSRSSSCPLAPASHPACSSVWSSSSSPPALTGSVQVGATAATQGGSTTLSAPYVQPGPRPASSDKAKLVGTVRFTPAREGRPVVIQRSARRASRGPTWRRRSRTHAGVGDLHRPRPTRTCRPWDAAYAYRGVAKSWRRAVVVRRQRPERRRVGAGVHATSSAAPGSASSGPTARVKLQGVREGRRPPGQQGRARHAAAHGEARPRPQGPHVQDQRAASSATTSTVRSAPSTSRSPSRTAPCPARIKFHKNRGAHGAFWMQPTRRQDGARPRAGRSRDRHRRVLRPGLPAGRPGVLRLQLRRHGQAPPARQDRRHGTERDPDAASPATRGGSGSTCSRWSGPRARTGSRWTVGSTPS